MTTVIINLKRYKPLFVFLLAAFALLVIGRFTEQDICVVYRITGIPCPSCGMTRAWLSFLQGDVLTAFSYHPLFLLVIVVALPAFMFYKSDRVMSKWCRTVIWLLVLIFMGTWVFRMILFFPGTPPMNYNQSSLFYRVYIFLRK